MRHVLFATALALAACGPTPDEVEQITEAASAADLPREYAILQLEPDIEAGEQVYVAQCLGCHRPNGIDGLGPSLPAYVASSGPLAVVEITIYGQGRMTAIGARLSDQEVADLVGYLFDEWGE